MKFFNVSLSFDRNQLFIKLFTLQKIRISFDKKKKKRERNFRMHTILSLLFTLENFVLLFKGLTFVFKICVSVNASFCASTVLKNSSTVLGSVDFSPSFAANSYAYLLGSFVIIAQGLIATPLCAIALWNKPVKVK